MGLTQTGERDRIQAPSPNKHRCFTAHCTIEGFAVNGHELALCVSGRISLPPSLPPCPLRSIRIGSAASAPWSLPRPDEGKVLANTLGPDPRSKAPFRALRSAAHLPPGLQRVWGDRSRQSPPWGGLNSNPPALPPESPGVLGPGRPRPQLYLCLDLSARALGSLASRSWRWRRSRGPPGTSRAARGAARGAGRAASGTGWLGGSETGDLLG